MEKTNKYLRIGGILNLIIGVLMLVTFKYSVWFFSIILIGTGIALLSMNNREEFLMKNHTSIFAIACIMIVFNLLCAIFLFLAYSEISSYKCKQNTINAPPIKIKKKVDPEVRKIDILLKLGVGMVFISGILFATTSWNFISDIVKAIFLILFGCLFIGLSLFVERKLKLYHTSYIYWLLGISFLFFSMVASFYFGIFGQALTYEGIGNCLAYSLTSLTAAGLLTATYLRFPKDYLVYAIYSSILIALVAFLEYFNIENMTITAMVSLMTLIILIATEKHSKLFNFSIVISYLLICFIIINILDATTTATLLACITNVVIHYYLTIKDKNEGEHYDSIIITYALILMAVYKLPSMEEFIKDLLIFIIISIHTLLIKLGVLKTRENYQKLNYILYTILTIVIIFMTHYESNIASFLISLTYLVINLILLQETESAHSIQAAAYLEPVAIILTIGSFCRLEFLSKTINLVSAMSITSIVYCCLNYLLNKTKREEIYFIAAIILSFICLEANIIDKTTLASILSIVTAIYLFVISHKEELSNHQLRLISSYILLLINIHNLLVTVNIFQFNLLVASLLLAGFLIIMILLNSQRIVKNVSYFAMTIPILHLISYFNFSYCWISISSSILILYVTFLIIKFFCKNESTKSTIGVIGIAISVLRIFFVSDPIVGIYIGIIGILAILLSFYKKELKSFFYEGVIITIINIIYRLRDFWSTIPFWLYLLFGGLALIGFVTYKEIKKK